MRLVAFTHHGSAGVGLLEAGGIRGYLNSDPEFPGELDDLVRREGSGFAEARSLPAGKYFAFDAIRYRPPFTRPNKILCVGLNYRDHTTESHYQQPDYPTLFARFNTSLVAHSDPIIRPRASEALDFEGELVAVIGRGGRHIAPADALAHVAGYSL